jgi:hypothetical protein
MSTRTDTITFAPSDLAERFGLGLGLAALPAGSGLRHRVWSWAYRYIRTLVAVQFVTAVVLAGVGALVLSQGYSGWPVLLLAIAALHVWIGYLDITVARAAHPRS